MLTQTISFETASSCSSLSQSLIHFVSVFDNFQCSQNKKNNLLFGERV